MYKNLQFLENVRGVLVMDIQITIEVFGLHLPAVTTLTHYSGGVTLVKTSRWISNSI